jgi:hypothetical protein
MGADPSVSLAVSFPVETRWLIDTRTFRFQQRDVSSSGILFERWNGQSMVFYSFLRGIHPQRTHSLRQLRQMGWRGFDLHREQ